MCNAEADMPPTMLRHRKIHDVCNTNVLVYICRCEAFEQTSDVTTQPWRRASLH